MTSRSAGRRNDDRRARLDTARKAAARRRRGRTIGISAAGVAVLLVGTIVTLAATRSGSPTPSASPSAPGGLLASIDSAATGATVDGIQCQAMESVLFHIHAHLAVYVDGQARGIPEGIGITPPRQEQQSAQGPYVTSGRCFYWLHSHTADGIVHIESPVQRTFTLGDYFDIWHQPLDAGHVGPATGAVTAYVNGTRYTGNPRDIPLTAHAVIQLDVGTPTPAPVGYTFPSGL